MIPSSQTGSSLVARWFAGLGMLLLAVCLGLTPARAHNLQTKFAYLFFDPDTQACLDARIAKTTLPPGCAALPGGWAPGDPLLQAGDELGFIIKLIPRDGTTTGVGGHLDFYIPSGVRVIDAAYLLPGDSAADGITGYDKVPMKGQSLIAIGAGPVGARATTQLIGLGPVGPNVNGVTEDPVAAATGLHRGTIAGVYGDTGIFYSTDPDTAYGSWQRFTGDPDKVCGLAGTPGLTGKTITNNSGDVFVPCNKWDAGQMFAWGVKGTTCTDPACSAAPIVDYGDGRGNTPWGFGSGVAGPQSGYAWAFDWNKWRQSARTAADMRAAMSNDSIGPWKRIKYAGSRVALDQPGSASTVIGIASKDASKLGIAPNTLPPTVSQTDSTSPKTLRWAVGQLTLNIPEYAWVKIKVSDRAALLNEYGDGCPRFHGDTFGGDAGGDNTGKDHLWRYYEPSRVTVNACIMSGKPTDVAAVKVGQTFQYKVKTYNLGSQALTNVVVKDTLPSGVSFVSAFPAQSSGPNPLVWNLGAVLPGQSFESLVTVKATGTGLIENTMCVTSDQFPNPECTTEANPSGNYPILKQTKTVNMSSVAPGGDVKYTITIANIGSGPTGNPVKIDDHLDSGVSYVSLDSVTVNGASYTATYAAGADGPTFTVPAAINAGQQLVLKFNANVSATANAGTYCNSFTSWQNSLPLTTGSQACVTVGGGSIGDTVWRDWNGNGMKDAGEEGIPGVTVNLYQDDGDGIFEPGAGDTLSQTDTTDANGLYSFTGLTDATYWVKIASGVPADHTLSRDPEGAIDGQARVVLNGATSDIDFGYKPGGGAAINGTVFDDTNSNGAPNDGEPGIPSVTVNLYEDTDGNGAIQAGIDLLIATTVSDPTTGAYSFPNLATGLDYIVDVVASDPDLSTFYSPYPYGQTSPDKVAFANLTGLNTANFGFQDIVPASVGGQVFVDVNGDSDYDAGIDAPMANITVKLYLDANGDGVADPGEYLTEQSTDALGNYTFGGLAADDYIVVVDNQDEDIPPGLSAGTTRYAVNLPAGTDYLTADFPFESLMSKSVAPASAAAGEILTYTILPKYPGPELLTDTKVTDPIPAGTTYVADSANAGGEFLDTSDPADGDPDSIVWSLGSNSDDLPGITPPSGKVLCPATLTVNPEADTFIDEENKDIAGDTSGSTTTFRTSFENGKRKHALLRFNLNALPAGASIESATLQTTLSANYGGTKQTVQVRNLVTAFAETTATWNDPNGTTGGDWATAGAFGASDYGTTVYSSAVVPKSVATVSFTVTDLVKSWQTGPNNGMVLLATGTSDNRDAVWYSRSGATQPTLAIKYLLESSSACSGTADALAVVDTYINEEKKDENRGTLATLVTRNQTNKDRNTLLRFNLAAVPSGATINAVTLRMNVQTQKSNHIDTLYEEVTPWTETGATWNKRDGSASWAGGSVYSTADYNSSPVLGTIDPSSKGLKTTTSTALRDLIAARFAGTKVNTGLVLITTGTDSNDVVYSSHESTTEANRPRLLIEWTLTPVASVETRTELHINDRLHSGSSASEVEVTMTVLAKAPVTGVSPGALMIDPGVATVSCGSASPPGPVDLAADVPTTFSYLCSVTPSNASPSAVSFRGKPTSSSGVTFNIATSEGLRVSPPLTYQVTVNSPAPPFVNNVATLSDSTAGLNASDDAITAIGPSIGDFVWADLDGDTVQDSGEPGIAGVRVYLDSDNDGAWDWTDADLDGTVSPGDTYEPFAFTDSSGHYRIYGVTKGSTYNVRYDLLTVPSGYTATTPLPHTTTSLSATEQYSVADFGLKPPQPPAGYTGSIGDYVWLDANSDGVQDADEFPLPDIIVKLYRDNNGNGAIDAGETLVSTDTTDANGLYSFTSLPYGTDSGSAIKYLVQVDEATSSVTLPYQYPGGPTTVNLGTALDPTTGTTNPRPVSLYTGSVNVTNTDLGYNWAGSIGDLVWWDYNATGVKDTNEPAIAGAYVFVYADTNGNGVYDKGIDPQVGRAITDENGIYTVGNLPPGAYFVDVYEDSVNNPNGTRRIVPTTGDVLKRVIDCPTTCSNFTDADFGYFEGALVEGTVFWDANHNGTQAASGEPGLANITITLTGADNAGNPVTKTVTTDASGHYQFIVPAGRYTVTYNTGQTTTAGYPEATNPVSVSFAAEIGEDHQYVYNFGVDHSGKIGNRVWNDAINNGIQDNTGESGIAGVTVELYASNGTTLLDTTATDGNGNYSFPGLADGTYVVKAIPPTGFTATGEGDPGTPCGGSCDNAITITVSGGAANNTADFGYKTSAAGYTVSGTIWDDNGTGGGTAGNGTKDGSEPGIAGVTVTLYKDTNPNNLYDAGEPVFATATTNASGAYSFNGVPDGEYVVKVDTATLPSTAFVQTGDPDGTKNNQSDVTVNGANPSAENFGYNQSLGGIAGKVCDGNGDGLCNNATFDSPLSGVTVILRWGGADSILGTDDDVTATVTTAADGRYAFDGTTISGTNCTFANPPYTACPLDSGLPPGPYQISETNLTGYESIADADGGNPDNISLVLASGQTKTDQDFEDRLVKAAIGDYIWLDVDGDGVQDVGEPGLPNVTVKLYSASNALIATQLTDANGNYLFAGIGMGAYYVDVDQATLPSDLQTAPATTDPSKLITIATAEQILDVDFGYVSLDPNKAIIGNRIWADADADGVQDPGEAGIAGVTVNLKNSSGTVATTTGPTGAYLFTGIIPGTYTVEIAASNFNVGQPLNGYAVTSGPQSEGANTSTARALLPGDILSDVDFGYDKAALYTITDKLWFDLNADGMVDATEKALAGVTVNLLDANGKVVATIVSDANGNFTFSGVPNGSYSIAVADNTGEISNLSGTTKGGSLSLPVIAGGVDVNGDGVVNGSDDGILKGPVDWSGNGTVDATSVAIIDGKLDMDGDGSINASDVGTFAGVSVIGGQLDINHDASIDAADKWTGYPVTVNNANATGMNFGYNIPGAIGDTVWSDNNGNGVRDPGEVGLSGAIVLLYKDANANSTFEPGTDALIGTQVSDSNGNYLFQGIQQPGTYFVSVSESQFALTGYSRTTADDETGAGAAGAQREVALSNTAATSLDADFGYRNTSLADVSGSLWNDLNKNAVDDGDSEPPIPGVTVELLDQYGQVVATTTTIADGSYTFLDVKAGSYKVVVTDQAGALDGYTLTSGLDQIPVTVGAVNIANVNFGYVRKEATGSIGDSVWLDANNDGLYQSNETGLAGVTLYLCSSSPCTSANRMAITTTDANGNYLFSGLPAGNYYVGVNGDTVPSNLTGATYPTGTTGQIALSDGQSYLGADFGYTPATNNATLGNTVWYDVNGNRVRDAGEVGIGGVKVTVLDKAGKVVTTVTTNPDGSWLAVIPEDATASEYVVFVDKTTLPGGVVTTPTNMNGGDTYIVSVKAGDVRTNLNFGYTGGNPGSIGNAVFLDVNNNGQWDAGEGLSGVNLQLYSPGVDGIAGNADDKFLASTTTDPNGNYLFSGLLAGDYYVDVAGGVPAGLTLEASFADPTAKITLTAGQAYTTADFGYQPSGTTAVIGNRVWSDDGDGVQDAGEVGIGGATVYLCSGTPATCDSSNAIRTAVTNPDGGYLFANVAATGVEDYKVTVVPPAGYTATPTNNGGSTSYTLTDLASGQIVLAADWGFKATNTGGSIGDLIYRSDLGNAGIAGVTVSLVGAGADGNIGRMFLGLLIKSSIYEFCRHNRRDFGYN